MHTNGFQEQAEARVTAGFLQPPLLMAATANDPEGVRLLCEANCSPDQRNFLAVSAVEAASTYGSLEAIEELVSQQQARGRDCRNSLEI